MPSMEGIVVNHRRKMRNQFRKQSKVDEQGDASFSVNLPVVTLDSQSFFSNPNHLHY